MSDYDMRAFCSSCGAYSRRMPFGDFNPFWLRGPCPRCGSYNSEGHVCRRQRVGRWPWQRAWVTDEGVVVGDTTDTPERPS
jgi:hypothetical protein